jgi:hypothetical protein
MLLGRVTDRPDGNGSMARERITFGGINSLEADELVPIDYAIEANDCQLDDGTIKGRHGYKSATEAAVGATSAQGIWRYRAGPSTARTVVAAGGKIHTITDPASETTYGTADAGTTKFGSADNISAAQLGAHLYLGSDNSDQATYPMVRVHQDFSLESLTQLAIPDKPTLQGLSTYSVLRKFSAATARTAVNSGVITTKTSGTETYYEIGRSGAVAQKDDGILIQLGSSGEDWTQYSTIVLAVAPPYRDVSGAGGVKVELGTSDTTPVYETVAVFKDSHDLAATFSPGVCYGSLEGITSVTLGKVKWIKLTLTGNGRFACYGFFLATRTPGVGQVSYRTTFYDIASAQESQPSPQLDVTISEPTQDSFPTFTIIPSIWQDQLSYAIASVRIDPQTLPPQYNANRSSGLATPARAVFAGAPGIRQAIPTAYQSAGSLRLWRLTATGWRLIVPAAAAVTGSVVSDAGNTSSTFKTDLTSSTTDAYRGRELLLTSGSIEGQSQIVTAYNGTTKFVTLRTALSAAPAASDTFRIGYLTVSATWLTTTTTALIADGQGNRALSSLLYKAVGTQGRCNAMAARHGRLILGWENRLFISSYEGADTSASEPYPQFPAIALTDDDGWAFDVAPANTEQIQQIVDGDALYVITNERVRAMWQVSPNSPIYHVWGRGAVSRRGAIYAEDRLYWAAWDGVYSVQGRAVPEELTRSVRRTYVDWLAPGSSTVIAYQNRKLIIINGTKYLRLDLVTGRWTRGTLADTLSYAACWHDPGASLDQCWLLSSGRYPMRWQAAALTDNGTAIASWSYKTGYMRAAVKCRVAMLLADVTATVTVTLHKTSSSATRTVSIATTSDGTENEQPAPADVASYKWRLVLTGANTTQVRYLAWELDPIEARGG